MLDNLSSSVLKITVDMGITVGQLKKELQRYVGVSHENFKLYRYHLER